MTSDRNTAGLLTADEISEFQRLVQEATGTWLDDDTAARRASQLLYLTRALIGRLPEEAMPGVLTSSGLDENPGIALE